MTATRYTWTALERLVGWQTAREQNPPRNLDPTHRMLLRCASVGAGVSAASLHTRLSKHAGMRQANGSDAHVVVALPDSCLELRLSYVVTGFREPPFHRTCWTTACTWGLPTAVVLLRSVGRILKEYTQALLITRLQKHGSAESTPYSQALCTTSPGTNTKAL